MAGLIAHLPELIVALGVGLVLVMYLTTRPGAYVVVWLIGICFVPWWVGTKVQTFLPVAVILSLLGLLCLTPAVPRRITLPDLGVLCFFAACLLPVSSADPSSRARSAQASFGYRPTWWAAACLAVSICDGSMTT